MRKFFPTWFTDTLYKNLVKNAGILLGGNTLASFFGLISLAVTIRALGAENLGLLVLAHTYTTIVDRLINFQSWQALIKFGAEALSRKQMEEFKELVKSSSMIDFLSALAGTIIAILGINVVTQLLGWEPVTKQMCITFSFAIMFHLSGTPIAILRLFGKFKLLAIHKVLASAFKLVAVLIAFILNQDVWVYLYIWVAADIFNHLILLAIGHIILYKKRITQWHHAGQSNFLKFFRFTFWTNITSTFDLPVKQLDILLVSSIISLEATGIYKVIKQIGGIVVKMAEPVYQAIFPDFTKQIAENKINEALIYAFRVGGLLFLIAFPAALIAGFTSVHWVPLVFGASFTKGLFPLSLFLILKAISIAFITLHPLFVALGFVRQNAIIILLTNITFIVTAYVLATFWGLTGVVFAYAVPMLFAVALKLIIIKQHQAKSN